MALIEEFVADRSPPQLYQAYLAPLFETWSDALVAALPPIGRVLDVACGTGIVSRKIARQPGVERVVAIDIALPMVEAARAYTNADANIEFHQASAEQMPFESNSFEAAYCQHGLQFFPDKVLALNELGRLLKSGGRAAIAVWTSARDGNPVFAAFEQVVAEELGSDLVPFGPFSFGDATQVEAVADKSDLTLVSLEKQERPSLLPDARTLVLFDLLFLGRPDPDGSMHPLFDPSDATKDSQIESIIARLTQATAQFRQSDGRLLAPSTAHVLVLEKG